jgi:hypothetical protein
VLKHLSGSNYYTMTTLRKLTIRLRAIWFRFFLRLFPRLRDHENLLHSIDQLKITNSRLVAELAISKTKESEARAEAQTSSLAARQALDRASQLTLANEQLQSQLLSTTQLMADRLERAYGGTFNWAALGGFSSRRAPYPWLPLAEPPEMKPIDTKGAIGRTSLRGEANRIVNETMNKMREGARNPKTQEAVNQTFDEVQRMLQSGELIIDASGQIWPGTRIHPPNTGEQKAS